MKRKLCSHGQYDDCCDECEKTAKLSNSAVMPGSDALMDAAYAFVDGMVPRADVLHNHTAPLWYGWALREAFIAGSKFKE